MECGACRVATAAEKRLSNQFGRSASAGHLFCAAPNGVPAAGTEGCSRAASVPPTMSDALNPPGGGLAPPPAEDASSATVAGVNERDFMQQVLQARNLNNEQRVEMIRRFSVAKETLQKAAPPPAPMQQQQQGFQAQYAPPMQAQDPFQPGLQYRGASWGSPPPAAYAPQVMAPNYGPGTYAYPPMVVAPAPPPFAAPPNYGPAQWARERLPWGSGQVYGYAEEDALATICCPCYTISASLRGVWRLLLLVVSWGVVIFIGYTIFQFWKRM